MQLRSNKRKCVESGAESKAKKRKINPLSDPITLYNGVYYIRSRPQLDIYKVKTVYRDEEGKYYRSFDDDVVPKNMTPELEITTKQNGRYRKLHILEEDYIRPDFPTDQYKNKQHDTEPEKLQRNYQFAKFIERCYQPGTEVLILDSPAITTTDYLVSINRFTPEQIHVPNLDRDFVKNAPKSFPKKARAYHSSVYEWIRDLPEDDDVKYHFGADYCCTFTGNKYIKPKADLSLFFHRKLLPKQNGVLWLTFSTRGKNVEDWKLEVLKFVRTVSQTNGYNLYWLNSETYTYKLMLYFFFVSF